MLGALALSLIVGSAAAQQPDPSKTVPTKNPFITGADIKPRPDTVILDQAKKQEVLDALSDVVTRRAFVPGVDLSKWPDFLAKQQAEIDKSEKDYDFSRAVNAALRDFGVSHIRFSTPRGSQARVQTSTIGIGISVRIGDDGLNIMNVFPGSPAETAGLKANESIVMVDGKKPDSNEALQGDEGTEVDLKIKGADGNERELKIKRQRYSTLRPDTITWPAEDAAVINIHSFARGYDRDAIDKMVGEAVGKAKYLVLDLRSNGGGAVDNLQHLLSLLMPEDTVIGTFISRDMADDYAKAHDGKPENDPIVIAKDAPRRYTTSHLPTGPFTGKIAVLVNGGSASASEICAWALREDRQALVVGTNSAGAVLASVYRRLPYGFEIQYPVSDYVSKNGVRLEKNPIKPDIEVTDRPADGKDPAVDAALAKLREG